MVATNQTILLTTQDKPDTQQPHNHRFVCSVEECSLSLQKCGDSGAAVLCPNAQSEQ
jgi:hypothetical protein